MGSDGLPERPGADLARKSNGIVESPCTFIVRGHEVVSGTRSTTVPPVPRGTLTAQLSTNAVASCPPLENISQVGRK